jgi:hypothetical protein
MVHFLICAGVLFSCLSSPYAQAQDRVRDVLPGTSRLTWEDTLDVRLMDGAHRYIERKIAESPQYRSQHWTRDLSSPGAYTKSVEPNRERLRTIIGAVDRGREINHNIGLPALPVPVQMERFHDDGTPAPAAENAMIRIWRVRWPVLKGVHGEGLLLEPRERPRAQIVLIPDADQLPEQLAGLVAGLPPDQQAARRLAENGCRVIVPALIDRDSLFKGNARQTHREWIYRQAFHMGRHVIGFEVEKIEAAVDWLQQTAEGGTPVGVAGYGEGGLIACYAAAVDTRIHAALVSGYFGPREAVWA